MTTAVRERGPARASTATATPLWRHPLAERVRVGLGVGIVIALMTGGSGTSKTYATVLRNDFISVHGVESVLGFGLVGILVHLYARAAGKVQLARTRVAEVNAKLERPWTRVAGVNIGPRTVLFAAALVVAVIGPNFLTLQWQNILNEQVAIYVLLALGLNVVVGLAGLLDLGYIAFFAIGAYTTAYFTGGMQHHVPPVHIAPLVAIPLAIVAAMFAGLVLGAPTLRLRGDYLAIVTLGFGEIVHDTAVNAAWLTGGSFGAHVPLPSVGWYHWSVATEMPFWYLYLPFIVLVIYLFFRVEQSRVGRSWTAIREDEVAAQSAGINTLKYKLMAFAIGASTSGLAGVLWSSKIGYVDPQAFDLPQSILVLVLVVFGGMGSMTGVVAGAVLIQVMTQHFRNGAHAEDQYIYLGALMILMMILRPQGLIPSRRRAREFRMAELGLMEGDAMTAPTEAP